MTRSILVRRIFVGLGWATLAAMNMIAALFIDQSSALRYPLASLLVIAIYALGAIVVFRPRSGWLASKTRKPVPPVELPPPPANLVGREEIVAEIEQLLSDKDDHRVIVILGGPGIGKTSLALHIAHTLGNAYTTGQLFASFGSERSSDSREINKRVLGDFLRALRRIGDAAPDGLDSRIREFRKATAPGRILTILDDVQTERIGDLIPRAPGCATIITTRHELRFEGDVQLIRLGPLGETAAVDMLKHTVGESRINSEIAWAGKLAETCAYHPLSLQLAAAALVCRPASHLSWILRQVQTSGGTTALDFVFALLPPDEREALLRLGLLQQRFEPRVLSRVLKAEEKDAWKIVDRLVAARLVERFSSDATGAFVYKTVEHVQEYARHKVEELPQQTRKELKQLLNVAAPQAVPVSKFGQLRSEAFRHLDRGELPRAQRLAHEALLMARNERDEQLVALAHLALAELKAELGGTDEVVELAQWAWKHPSSAVQARVSRIMGHVQRRVRRVYDAEANLKRALRHAGQDKDERVRILTELGLVFRLNRDPKSGLSSVEEALSLVNPRKATGRQRLAKVLLAQGMIYSETGDFRSGLESLRQAKEEAKGAEQHLTLAWIDYRIAQIYFRSDSFDVATELAFDSLDSFARLQHRYGTGHCRLLLSQIFGRTGRLPSAVQVGEEALETFANCGDWWMERLAAIELAKRKVSDGSTAEATQLARRAINLGEPRLSLSRLGMHIAWELVKGSLVRPAAPLLTSMARDLAVSRKD